MRLPRRQRRAPRISRPLVIRYLRYITRPDIVPFGPTDLSTLAITARMAADIAGSGSAAIIPLVRTGTPLPATTGRMAPTALATDG